MALEKSYAEATAHTGTHTLSLHLKLFKNRFKGQPYPLASTTSQNHVTEPGNPKRRLEGLVLTGRIKVVPTDARLFVCQLCCHICVLITAFCFLDRNMDKNCGFRVRSSTAGFLRSVTFWQGYLIAAYE